MILLTVGILFLNALTLVAFLVDVHYSRREERKVDALLTVMERIADSLDNRP